MNSRCSTAVRFGALTALLALAFSMIGVPSAAAETDRSFQVTCSFSHDRSDDPIVFPGQPGKSHHHVFFGNPSTDARSTAESLYFTGVTTCDTPYDLSAYWTPDLLVDGRSVKPSYAVASYEARGKTGIRPFPFGLKMIVGDAHAHHPQDPALVKWNCGGSEVGGSPAEVPNCGWWQDTTVRYNFPDCWNGRDLDASDHKSHLAFSSGGRCPASHPVAVPGVRLTFGYSGIGDGGKVALASGGPMTAHADLFNAWDPTAFAYYVGLFLG
ncbi:protein of unknown function [Amycolatopsis arida]|uniref:DUF1996 domain-containing protein n=1 Tax=Amycolatopsis arida TaxID=587909 RepID=A0A1I5QXD6_9PSEU|nr:DUF1996 domain-containing protein [Amycolatopsis arida]TDX98984.1 uncharacterized protein DUF1996 [Amycolatopsis arida]SFP50476.1 protein of unknown function [Amycolatopsis arida]